MIDEVPVTPFDRALGVVLGHEGGDSDHADDPGGFTRFGISQIAHPTVDVRSLTREKAGEIYRAEYWTPMRCDELPPPLALCVFDAAVNQGRMAAGRLLQESVGTTVDGVIGEKTLVAVYRHPVSRLIRRFMTARAQRYIATGGFATFGRGWIARAIDVAVTAAEWEMEDEA